MLPLGIMFISITVLEGERKGKERQLRRLSLTAHIAFHERMPEVF